MTLLIFMRTLLFSFAVLPRTHAATLVSNLSQNQTNGVSVLGTLNATLLPQFVTANNTPTVDGYPWGPATMNNTDPYEDCPATNMTRYWNFTIARGFKAPDGLNRSVIMINDQIPGPTIEANWGDTIQVTVTNNIDGEGTSIHWHGLLQKQTQWSDGVPSVQQCPIAPGTTFTYTFRACAFGTSWYHSHYSAQYADGLAGPLIIHGPRTVKYDHDIGPIFLSDWYHNPYYHYVENPASIPSSDNNLINGKANFDCSGIPANTTCVPNAGLSIFRFQSGKTHRLRLINAGAEAIQRFHIDGYQMTVFANDNVPIIPYNTTVVTLGAGQRTDVTVYASGTPTDAVWMRSDISAKCSTTTRGQGLAAIFYENANVTQQPTTVATAPDDSHCGNDNLNLTIPWHNYPPLAPPAVTKEINITVVAGQWEMNGQTFKADWADPILLLANEGNTSYPTNPQWNVYNFGSNSSIRLVLRNQGPPISHPMHLHGHNFWVLAEGSGDWNGTVNTKNPQRRDTQLLQPNGYLVLQFAADNPGVWAFHCHIAWHASSGLYANVMERPADIAKLQIPSAMAQTCQDWSLYLKNHTVAQLDSGL